MSSAETGAQGSAPQIAHHQTYVARPQPAGGQQAAVTEATGKVRQEREPGQRTLLDEGQDQLTPFRQVVEPAGVAAPGAGQHRGEVLGSLQRGRSGVGVQHRFPGRPGCRTHDRHL